MNAVGMMTDLACEPVTWPEDYGVAGGVGNKTGSSCRSSCRGAPRVPSFTNVFDL